LDESRRLNATLVVLVAKGTGVPLAPPGDHTGNSRNFRRFVAKEKKR